LDPLSTPELVWFRDDFANEELRSLLLRLVGSPTTQHGIPVPGEATSISLAVNPIEPRPAATIWARTMDANNVFRFHQFGSIDFTGYREMTAPIAGPRLGIAYPISVVGIMITQAGTINQQTPGVVIDDLT